MADVKAQLNGLRMAPRKVRAVANLIKGKDAVFAVGQLEFLIRKPSDPVKNLLKSAIGNAENNFHLVKENLYVKEVKVNEGVKLRRFKPKGFGRAALIQKKTSRLVIVLGERVPGLKNSASKPEEHKKEKIIKEDKIKAEDKKPEIKKEIGTKKKGFVKKMFQRKSI